jgi:hypothetical protein
VIFGITISNLEFPVKLGCCLMVSINDNEIYLNKVFKRAKDTQFDYIENSRDMSSAKP